MPQVVERWLEANGWVAGRDIGDRADELIKARVGDSDRQGAPLAPVPAATRIIRAFGLLTLEHPAGTDAWCMKPTLGYEGDAAAIHSLASGLGTSLFPVGYEMSEYGIILVDKLGRFFLLHHTGGYFLGKDAPDSFTRFLHNADLPDAEDFFV